MASHSFPAQKPSDQSCFFQKRKPINPLANSLRSSLSRSTGNSVRQRVLSAKLLKLKSVQNQLNDANFHLAEAIRENQALKTLQKRQDRALSKYEGTNAELPRLIQSHEEEIRFLTEKNKVLRKNVKELSEQLKHRNDEVQHLQEQLRHFEKLDKDKHLLEREKLIEELEDVKIKLHKADNEIVILNRKLALESKTSKQRLNLEMAKHKQCQKELAQSLTEIGKLTKLLESRDKSQINGRKRFSNLGQRQSLSLISLNGTKSNLTCDDDKTPVTDVKLEPITQPKKEDTQIQVIKPYKGILKCPSENIKARLSADSKKDSEDELPSVDKMSLGEGDSRELRSRPSSSHKLEKIEMHLQNTIRRVEDNKNNDDFNKRLGDYCVKALDTVKSYTDMIESNRENLEHAKADTDKLVETLKEAESLELKLKRGQALPFDSTDLTDDNLDFVSQILSEEAEFQKKYKDKDRNGNKKEPTVGLHDKKKLLATLRAIDNGDSIDSFENGSQRRNKLMKELFGDIAD
ncbi:flagellar attachment zone protein 1 [Asbolus verrucosus]|uniref:Flagellar attachment zone protein 1 n=1 Tax=Asbolus verrucosus TaxID=1661398 RepID=A0A482VPG4_ASBVE|nr:flagellar attachment zone protein 1 [Asbolus verrucosus]